MVPSFHPARAYGGPIRSVYELCRHLASAGVDVRVLTTDADGIGRVIAVDTRHEGELDGFRIRYCRRRLAHSVSPDLLRELRAVVEWADVVHLTAVYSFPTIPTLWAARRAGRGVVWSPRGSLQRWPGARRVFFKKAWELLCRRAMPGRVTLHVTSPEEATASRRRVPEAAVELIPNGVWIPDAPGPKALVEKPGPAGPRLLFVGRLDPIKGLDRLLRACRLADADLGPDWSLTIVGSGEPAYAESLARLAAELEIAERVRFTGHLAGADKERAFGAADLAVLASHTENFGMFVAEALAHAIPVVASHGSPWSELEERGCGLHVANDPESLAAALRRANALPLAEMGRRGRRWMREDFSWERVAERMEQVYRDILAPCGSP